MRPMPEEAARFYAATFPGSRIGAIARYGEEAAVSTKRKKARQLAGPSRSR